MLTDGQTLTPRYQIIRKLNQGGMGTVYEAFDTTLNARVAIKENLSDHECLRAAFRREAQLLANLQHSSLPRCSDLFSIGSGQYLVMEYIEGDDLAVLLAKRRSHLPVETVLDWARQLLDVLEYLHSHMTLHRDIKPSNIKVKDARLYLLDFGLAYGGGEDMTTVISSDFNWNCHSRKYSSLEQVRCERTTPASDLYSLGATLYTLLTAAPPNDAEHRMQLRLVSGTDPVRDLHLCRRDLNKNVSRAIMHALELSPDQRPKSAAEMRRLMFPNKVTPSNRRVVAKFVRMGPLAAVIPLGIMTAIFFPHLNANLCNYSEKEFLRQALRCEASTLEQSKQLAPSEQAARLIAEAEELLQRTEPEAALKKAEAALKLDPDNAYAHFVFGDTLWDIKSETIESVTRMPEIKEQADIILKLVRPPRSAQEYVARAWANLAKGKVDIAVADATAALESQPDSVVALMIRASAKANNADVDNEKAFESFADYKRVIQLMPKYAKAYANRGATYYALGQNNLALSDFKEAARLAPRASFLYKLGYVNFALQDFGEARSNFQRALQSNPQCYSAYLGLGDVYFSEEDWSNSVINYNRANQISPTHYAFSRLGNAYINLKEFQKSVESYKQAIILDPNDYRSQSGMGISYANVKDFNQAIKSFTRAIEHAPKNDHEFLAFVYKCRADAFRQLGESELAESDDQRANDR
jgi:serine/threonine protein kinase/Flp pilus assembly protein TadD